MWGTSESSGPFGFPPRNLELSVAMVMVRGVWHSPQWPTARTRYSPRAVPDVGADVGGVSLGANAASQAGRSEEHTSELQSQSNLVCRLLLEKKKKQHDNTAG